MSFKVGQVVLWDKGNGEPLQPLTISGEYKNWLCVKGCENVRVGKNTGTVLVGSNTRAGCVYENVMHYGKKKASEALQRAIVAEWSKLFTQVSFMTSPPKGMSLNRIEKIREMLEPEPPL